MAAVAGGVRFAVRLQPRASKTEIVGVHGDALKARVTAPPVDHAANEMLVELLAGTFNVSRQAITIQSGETSRTKVVRIDGVSEAAVQQIANRKPGARR